MNRPTRLRPARAALGALGLAIVLAACGSGDPVDRLPGFWADVEDGCEKLSGLEIGPGTLTLWERGQQGDRKLGLHYEAGVDNSMGTTFTLQDTRGQTLASLMYLKEQKQLLWIDRDRVMERCTRAPIDLRMVARSHDALISPGNMNSICQPGTDGGSGRFLVIGTDRDGHRTWGGPDVYSGDSQLASAVVHAGLLVDGEAGIVEVHCLGPQERFQGSSANGVTTMDWRSYPQSYAVALVAALGHNELTEKRH